MAKDFWVFGLFLYLVRADTEYELYNNDGWIPISNIQAYNTRRSDVEQPTQGTEYHDHFIQVVTPEVRSGKDFPPQETNPTKHEKRRNKFEETKRDDFAINCRNGGKNHYRYYFKIASDFNKPSYLYIVKLSGSTICPDRESEENSWNAQRSFAFSDTKRSDRSLDIIKVSTEVPDINGHLNQHEYKDSIKVNNEEIKTLQRKSYEVTEEGESDINHGYVYETPKPDTSNKLNLTNKLFNILAKYNIRADDVLQNYDQSLGDRVRNPTASELDRPFDFKARGYNSQDHLPVDPLLAVFLSHYGHYLPSAYGIRNNYNNAYGYLASNNIHNNKPFGMYKIFSDTDAPK